MVYESIIFAVFTATTCTLFWVVCAPKKKELPNPASLAPIASVAQKSESKEKDGEPEKKEEEEKKGDEEKKDEENADDKAAGSKEKDNKESGSKETGSKETGSKENDGKKKKETFISVSPPDLRFETAITSQKTLKIKNLTDKKVMFKIKASTTHIYLINPVFGKIEPRGTAEVIITHRPSEKREDKLVIMSSELVGKETDMAKTFKQIKVSGADVNVKLVSF